MIQEQTIKFNGRKANPDKILIGMVSDNISEAIKFILPVIDAGQSAFICWVGEDGETSDIVLLTAGETAGEYMWTVTDSDTSIAQTMDAYIRITAGESVIWASWPFKTIVGELPDVEGSIIERDPTILSQVAQQAQRAENAADEAEQAAATAGQYNPITGTAAPTTATAGAIGQHYVDTAHKKEYVCTAKNGSAYEWTLINVNEATQAAAGMMSAADKVKLDSLYPVKTGAAAPTTATTGEVGQLYVKTTAPYETYQCVNAASGVYIWINTANAYSADTYEEIQRIVLLALANGYFDAGDQILANHSTFGVLTWDVLDFDKEELVDQSKEHSMTIQLHSLLTGTYQFDATEALYYCESALAAGTYHFALPSGYDTTYGGGVSVQFTLSQGVPAGGVIMFPWAYQVQALNTKISTYASRESTTAIESNIAVTEGTDGTDLGTYDPTNNPNMNHASRARYGSNRWKESAVRQWLNSAAAAGQWWTPQTIFDRPPSYANQAGFLAGFAPEFLAVLGRVKKRTAKNTVTDGGGYEDTEETMFLLSKDEVYGTHENSVTEGPYYKYYADNANSPTDAAQAWRIKYRGGSAALWWLRSPDAGNGRNARNVNTTGQVNYNIANSASGLAPACVIC